MDSREKTTHSNANQRERIKNREMVLDIVSGKKTMTKFYTINQEYLNELK